MRAIGRILTLLGILLAAGTVIWGLSRAMDSATSLGQNVQNMRSATPGATVTVKAGEKMTLLRSDDAIDPTCSVTAPSGGSVSLHSNSGPSSTTTSGSEQWQPFASWRAPEAGAYDVRCSGGSTMVAPELATGAIYEGASGTMIAVAGGALGSFTAVIGAVSWAVGSDRESKRRAAALGR